MPKQIPSHADIISVPIWSYFIDYFALCLFLTLAFCISKKQNWIFAGQKLHAYIKLLQSPDLPLDEETTSFTDIPRGEFSYLQNSNIDDSNGQTQRRIVQCDIQEDWTFQSPTTLQPNAVRIITKTFTCFQIFMTVRHRYTARDRI